MAFSAGDEEPSLGSLVVSEPAHLGDMVVHSAPAAVSTSEQTVIVGGAECHVGGWCDYEVARRAEAKYGASGKELYPGRTYVTVHDVVQGLVSPFSAQLMATGAGALVNAQNCRARAFAKSARGKTSTSINPEIPELHEEIAELGESGVSIMQTARLLTLARQMQATLDQSTLEIDAARQAAEKSSMDARLAFGEIHVAVGSDLSICVCDTEKLRQMEARCAPTAALVDTTAGTVAAYAAAVGEAICRAESAPSTSI